MLHSATKNGYPIIIPLSFKNYHIIQSLGSGSTSIIVQLEQEDTYQQFAAKIMSKFDIYEQNLIDQINREIEVLKSLDHPNIIKIYDTFEIKNDRDDEYIVIVMDLCSNGDILALAQNSGFKDGQEKRKMLKQFLNAIRYLHKRNISHGDIKPDNILIDHNMNVTICDFGYCRKTIIAGDESKQGTLYYAAPELFHSGSFDTLKADIWSIGITLYALSELHLPFENGSTKVITDQIMQGKLSLSPEASPILTDLIKQCTQYYPNNRPSIDDIIAHEFFSNEDDEKDNTHHGKYHLQTSIYH